MSDKVDTSAANVQRVADCLEGGVHRLANTPMNLGLDAWSEVSNAMLDAAALLRALLAERDEARRIANGGCARDQRTTQFCGIAAEAHARGFREGVEAAAGYLTGIAANELASAQTGSMEYRLRCMDAADALQQKAAAIRALQPPEPQK